jgi:hypothetical protein
VNLVHFVTLVFELFSMAWSELTQANGLYVKLLGNLFVVVYRTKVCFRNLVW